MRLALGNFDPQSQRVDSHDVDHRSSCGQVFAHARFLGEDDTIQRRIDDCVGKLLFCQRQLRTPLRQQTLAIANLFDRILVTAECNFIF